MARIPARAQWLHARWVYIHELLGEGESPEQIARLLSCDPMQVRILGMAEPESFLEPWAKKAQKEVG